jgi:hypothetical protein
MALSLAACGGSDSSTTAVVETPAADTPAADTPVVETPVVPVTGAAYTLTKDPDTLSPTSVTAATKTTSGDDTFTAVFEAVTGGTSTIQSADTLDGGDGTDTLTIRAVDMDAGSSVSPSSSNIEVINITNIDATDDDDIVLNMGTISGVTKVSSVGSLSGTEINIQNLASTDVTLGLDGAKGDFNVLFTAAALTGSSTTVSVDVSNKSNATMTMVKNLTETDDDRDAIEALTINSTGSGANTLAFDVGDSGNLLKTITVTGDQGLTLTTGVDFDEVTTLNFSKNTGGVNIDINTNAKDVTATGGSGADRIDFDDHLTVDDTVDMGEGTDTLAVGAAVTSTTLDNVKNVERLEITADTDQDLSVIEAETTNTINTFIFSGTVGTAAPTKHLDKYNYIIKADGTSFVPVVASDDLSNEIKIELVNADVATVLDASGASDFETVTLISSYGASDALDGDVNLIDTEIDMAAGGTLNLEGAAALKIDSLVNSTVVNSTMTGGLTLVGSTSADEVTAGSGNDTINGYGGLDKIVITSGGTDTIQLEKNADGDTATITGFASGDTIAILDDNGDNGEHEYTSAASGQIDITIDPDDDTVIFTFNSKTTAGITLGSELIADFTDETDVAAYINEAFASAQNEAITLILNDGTHSYVYDVENTGADTTIAAGDIDLIGVVENYILTASDVAQV